MKQPRTSEGIFTNGCLSHLSLDAGHVLQQGVELRVRNSVLMPMLLNFFYLSQTNRPNKVVFVPGKSF